MCSWGIGNVLYAVYKSFAAGCKIGCTTCWMNYMQTSAAKDVVTIFNGCGWVGQ